MSNRSRSLRSTQAGIVQIVSMKKENAVKQECTKSFGQVEIIDHAEGTAGIECQHKRQWAIRSGRNNANSVRN